MECLVYLASFRFLQSLVSLLTRLRNKLCRIIYPDTNFMERVAGWRMFNKTWVQSHWIWPRGYRWMITCDQSGTVVWEGAFLIAFNSPSNRAELLIWFMVMSWKSVNGRISSTSFSTHLQFNRSRLLQALDILFLDCIIDSFAYLKLLLSRVQIWKLFQYETNVMFAARVVYNSQSWLSFPRMKSSERVDKISDTQDY